MTPLIYNAYSYNLINYKLMRKRVKRKMIITKSVEITRTEQIVVGKVCNKCGNVFSPHAEDIQPSNTDLGEYGNCKSEICNNCWLEFIRSFSIVPTGFKSSPHFTSSFDLDHELHQSLFKEWQISNVWNCDENPWKNYYSDGNSDQDNESCEEYEEYNEEISDALEVRKPLHINVVKLATIHKIGLVKKVV